MDAENLGKLEEIKKTIVQLIKRKEEGSLLVRLIRIRVESIKEIYTEINTLQESAGLTKLQIKDRRKFTPSIVASGEKCVVSGIYCKELNVEDDLIEIAAELRTLKCETDSDNDKDIHIRAAISSAIDMLREIAYLSQGNSWDPVISAGALGEKSANELQNKLAEIDSKLSSRGRITALLGDVEHQFRAIAERASDIHNFCKSLREGIVTINISLGRAFANATGKDTDEVTKGLRDAQKEVSPILYPRNKRRDLWKDLHKLQEKVHAVEELRKPKPSVTTKTT